MKQLLFILLFTISSLSFAQNTGMVVGKVVDAEISNEPLILANIAVKGTEITSDSDVTGLFLLENLAEGDYTLVCDFVGYESEEINVHVSALEPTEVTIALRPSTISLGDLVALSNVSEKDTKTPSPRN
jgi:hypothetical protein